MRVIFIHPDAESVSERVMGRPRFDAALGGKAAQHHAGHDMIPHHVAFVDEQGLVSKRTSWLFGGIRVWGPMIICGLYEELLDAKVSVSDVRRLCEFNQQ